MNYSQAAGGRMMEDIIDAMKRPDYGEIILSGAESTSALERALMELNADVRGTELISDARVKAAKMGAADAATLANAGTWAAGASAIGQVAGSAIGAIPTGGSGTGVNYNDNTPSVYGTYNKSAPPSTTSNWARPPALPSLP